MKPQSKKSKKFASLVLASASLGRAHVLKTHGVEFQIDVADIDEQSFDVVPIDRLVHVLAFEKAKKIKERREQSRNTQCLIVAVDTLVVIEHDVIGKPKSQEDAVVMLNKLSGKTHQVISGVVLWDLITDKMVSKIATSFVTFKPLSSTVISDYVSTEEPFGKAGGYASQGEGRHLIERIDGDPTNVIGMPMQCFYELLAELDYSIRG